MKRKILMATMILVLLAAGTAFAGARYGYGAGPCGAGRRGQPGTAEMRGPDMSWLEKAPLNVQDAFKQIGIKRSEISLEAAKGNTDAKKLKALHDDMLKSRRVVADYCFDFALKNPAKAKEYMDGARRRFGMRAGGGMRGGLFFELQNELRKDNPDTEKAKRIYTDAMNLMEKHSRENFELRLKYPDSLSRGYGRRF